MKINKTYFLNIFTRLQLIDILECFKNEQTYLLAVNLINNELKKYNLKFYNKKVLIFECADLRIALDNHGDILTFDIMGGELVSNRLHLVNYKLDVFTNHKYLYTKGTFCEYYENNHVHYIIRILEKDVNIYNENSYFDKKLNIL